MGQDHTACVQVLLGHILKPWGVPLERLVCFVWKSFKMRGVWSKTRVPGNIHQYKRMIKLTLMPWKTKNHPNVGCGPLFHRILALCIAALRLWIKINTKPAWESSFKGDWIWFFFSTNRYLAQIGQVGIGKENTYFCHIERVFWSMCHIYIYL